MIEVRSNPTSESVEISHKIIFDTNISGSNSDTLNKCCYRWLLFLGFVVFFLLEQGVAQLVVCIAHIAAAASFLSCYPIGPLMHDQECSMP